jgi:hypothetical protein
MLVVSPLDRIACGALNKALERMFEKFQNNEDYAMKPQPKLEEPAEAVVLRRRAGKKSTRRGNAHAPRGLSEQKKSRSPLHLPYELTPVREESHQTK